MKKNIVIVYEIFKREYIGIATLKYELEKRGYNVFIRNKSEDIFNGRCDLLVVPNSYTTENFNLYKYRFNAKNNKLLNLQIEQIHSKKVEDNLEWVSSGLANNCYFACWGENRKKQLLNVGVDESHIYISGAMHLDQLKEKFSFIWKSKENIANEYNINGNKKWIIYLSSLTYASTHSTMNNWTIKVDGYEKWSKKATFHRKTHLEVLKCIDYVLSNSNNIFIYRPHPTEEISDELHDLKKKYPKSLFIICDYNVKQWIKVCDIIITGLSTSVVECISANKSVLLYVPIKPSYEDDIYMFDGINTVTSFDEFKIVADSNFINTTLIPIKNIQKYIDISIHYSYLKVADYAERLLDIKTKNENFFIFNRIKYLICNGICIKVIVKKLYQVLFKRFGFRINNKSLRSKYFISNWEETLYEKIEFNTLYNKLCENLE